MKNKMDLVYIFLGDLQLEYFISFFNNIRTNIIAFISPFSLFRSLKIILRLFTDI